MKSCKRCGRPLRDDATLCSVCWTPADIVNRESRPADIPHRETASSNAAGRGALPVDGGPPGISPGGGADGGTYGAYVVRPEVLAGPPRHLHGAPTGGHAPPRYVARPVASPGYPPPGSAPYGGPPPGYAAAPVARDRFTLRWFLERLPGPILMGLIIISALAVGGTTPHYFGAANWGHILQSFCVLAPFAAGVALTARSGGPDFSLGSIALYGGMLMATGAAFPLALVAGAVAGFVNGVLVWLFRLPSFIATLVTGQVLLGAVYFSTDGTTAMLAGGHELSPGIFFAVGGFTLAAGFIYVLLTPAGVPFDKRPREGRRPLTFLFAYPLAGALAAFSGVLSIMRTGSFVPAGSFGFGGNAAIELLFIWAAIASSRLLDNRVAPVLWAALAAFVITLLANALTFVGFAASLQGYLKAVLTLILLFCVGLARWPFGKTNPTLYSPDG